MSSPNLGLILQTTGSNNGTWGVVLNSDLSIVDSRLGSLVTVNCAGSSNITVSASQAQNLTHLLTGVLTGNIEYIMPDAGGFYIISNNTTGSFTLKVVDAHLGTGVTIPQGTTCFVFVNSDVDVVSAALSYLPVLTVDTLTTPSLILSGALSAGSLTLGTPLAVAQGGTASTTASAARTALETSALAVAQTFSGGQRTAASVLTSTSNSTAIDLSLNNDFTATLTENTTFANPSNITIGQKGRIAITQASSAKTVAYGSYFKFPSGTVPTVSTGNGARDNLYYDVVSATEIDCNLVKGFA